MVVDLGDGNDTFTGGTGVETITGGAGADVFKFTASNSPPGSADTITDFVHGTDKLDFSGLMTTSFEWLGSGALSSSAGHSQARFDDATKTLQVDINGDGVVDITIKLTGVSASDLTASDFIWS